MAYFLFVDESGQDHRESPDEVLAGVAVKDRDLWNLVKALQEAEKHYFGMRYSTVSRELKAKKLLKRKTYRLAEQLPAFDFAAYITSWNVRFEGMTEPKRPDLDDLTEQLLSLQYRAIQEVNGNPNYPVWSFAVITDLRAKEDKL
ncbi:DUF3800 domain-containing protein [Trichothermofontia sp.]